MTQVICLLCILSLDVKSDRSLPVECLKTLALCTDALLCVDRKRETAQLLSQMCSAESTHGTEGQDYAANKPSPRSIRRRGDQDKYFTFVMSGVYYSTDGSEACLLLRCICPLDFIQQWATMQLMLRICDFSSSVVLPQRNLGHYLNLTLFTLSHTISKLFIFLLFCLVMFVGLRRPRLAVSGACQPRSI